MPIFLVVIINGLILFMVMRILYKTGHNPWWAVVSIIPVVNIVCLWIFALTDWKNVPRQ